MAESNLPTKILVVDHDESFISSVENALARQNIKVHRAAKLETAMYHFNTIKFDVVMVELDFTELPGLALIQKWRAHETIEKRTVGFIAVSSQGRSSQEDGLLRELGDMEIVNKPVNMIGLLSTLAKAMNSRKRALEFLELRGKVTEYYNKTKDLEKTVSLVAPRLAEMGPPGNELLLSLYDSSEKWDQALITVSKLLDIKQNDISLINSKARILLKLGKTKEAMTCLETADTLAPMNIQRLEQMADTYLQMQNPIKGVQKLQKLCDLHPEKPEYKFDAMQKLFDSGNGSYAKDFGRANTSPMDIVRHYNNKGVALSKTGSPDQAVDEYKRALEFFPNYKENYRIHYNIALANLAKKDPAFRKSAEGELEMCLKLNPGFDKASAALDLLRGTKGKPVSPPVASGTASSVAGAAGQPSLASAPEKGLKANIPPAKKTG